MQCANLFILIIIATATFILTWAYMIDSIAIKPHWIVFHHTDKYVYGLKVMNLTTETYGYDFQNKKLLLAPIEKSEFGHTANIKRSPRNTMRPCVLDTRFQLLQVLCKRLVIGLPLRASINTVGCAVPGRVEVRHRSSGDKRLHYFALLGGAGDPKG